MSRNKTEPKKVTGRISPSGYDALHPLRKGDLREADEVDLGKPPSGGTAAASPAPTSKPKE